MPSHRFNDFLPSTLILLSRKKPTDQKAFSHVSGTGMKLLFDIN